MSHKMGKMCNMIWTRKTQGKFMGKSCNIIWEKYATYFGFLDNSLKKIGGSREGGNPFVHGSSDDVVCDIVTTISGVIVTKRRKRGCVIEYT